MLASVVIVSYNSARYLEACLRSVFDTLPETCEVLVIDNASSDGSARLVRERFPRAILIENPENSGFAAANNIAAARARGEFTIALNPDTEVTPGWVESLLAPLRSGNPAVGAVTPKLLSMRERDRINAAGNSLHVGGIAFCRGLNRDADDAAYACARPVAAFSGACFAIRTALWRELGGFDETFFMYLEDTDFSLRLRLAGWEILYQPHAVVYHDYRNEFSARKLYYLERNRLQLLLKTYRMRTLLSLLPALAALEALTLGFCTARGALGSKIAAYCWIACHARSIAARRAAVQAARKVADDAILSVCESRLDLEQLAPPRAARAVLRAFEPLFEWCGRHTYG